ncbi:MAG: DUF6978 family protein [Gammaproteobacteria bacterium]
MPLTNAEFASIVEDGSKRIEGNIAWCEDEDHSPALEFRAEVLSGTGWPLFVRGSHNRLAGTLTYGLILKTEGRIYALDLGKDHHNPQCMQVGEKHKHRWTEQFRDKEAYVPHDITAPVSDPVVVWEQFCAEAKIEHTGSLAQPLAVQEELFS